MERGGISVQTAMIRLTINKRNADGVIRRLIGKVGEVNGNV